MGEERRRIPGDDTFPEYTLVCEECGREFAVSADRGEIDGMSCPECGSRRLRIRYIVYPTNGPGFQEGYDPETVIYGGCRAACGSEC